MSDSVLGAGILSLFGLMAVSLALGARRRPPDVVVTLGTARGRSGLAVHPWRGHWTTQAMGGLIIGLIVLMGLWEIGSSNYYAAAFFVGSGLLMAYLGWCRLTGRAGDGTVTLTPEGIHQLYAGSEVFVDWEDVRGLVTTRTDFIIETTRPVVPVHHLPPLLGRRGLVRDDAIALPRRHLPPLPFQEMVWLYSTSSAARDELGTDEPLKRARSILSRPA
ncbi:hypothetical protein [Kribbella sp. VKM Ac-2568]|uniref:hypothetical protein n=1 Tax=Kribbella sp. VKM Ac-2568 TaxID=2512219 RepID=UPI001047D22D|nr:hypothetical protein [Kribbella sp. VKM Ac-2568]TCM47901.1 hypothetical protein EV648_104296 [Kribbella sp. VKM Ac-2568]